MGTTYKIVEFEYEGHLITARVKQIEFQDPSKMELQPGYVVETVRPPIMTLEIVGSKPIEKPNPFPTLPTGRPLT